MTKGFRSDLKPKNTKRRKKTRRDFEREAYRQAGILDALPKMRDTPTDLERLVRAVGYNERLVGNLTFKEQQQLEADLTIIAAGRIQGTLPERLIVKWLLGYGFEYGGMGYNTNPSKDFFFQVPFFGGRETAGGTVVDIFMSSKASNTAKGMALFPEGIYFHGKPEQARKDEAKYLRLKAEGIEVRTITDAETYNPGQLDNFMRNALRK